MINSISALNVVPTGVPSSRGGKLFENAPVTQTQVQSAEPQLVKPDTFEKEVK